MLEGIVQNKVAPNVKCQSCLHYNMNRSVCEVGLQPSSCGNGSIPDMGYAPMDQSVVDVASAEMPSHAEVARAGGVPAPQDRIAIITTLLGDDSELLAMAKSLSTDLVKSCEWGCAKHQYGDSFGQGNVYTAGGECSCTPMNKSSLAHMIHNRLAPRDQRKISVTDLKLWVGSKISDIAPAHLI